MPYVYDPNRSASGESRRRTADTIGAVRRNQFGPAAGLDPNRTAAANYLNRSRGVRERTMNPQGAFQGNIARTTNAYERSANVNQRSIQGYFERANIINQRAQGY
jgi:hypothetical protein